MQKVDIVGMMLTIITPVENEIQDEIRMYLEENKSAVTELIYTKEKYRNEAILIDTLVTRLTADVCYEILNKNLRKGR